MRHFCNFINQNEILSLNVAFETQFACQLVTYFQMYRNIYLKFTFLLIFTDDSHQNQPGTVAKLLTEHGITAEENEQRSHDGWRERKDQRKPALRKKTKFICHCYEVFTDELEYINHLRCYHQDKTTLTKVELINLTHSLNYFCPSWIHSNSPLLKQTKKEKNLE